MKSSSAKPITKRLPPFTDRNIRGDNQPLSKSVRIEDLRKYFHLPIVDVARHLGTCTTALKKICRKNKINKWPYRQIRSITKSIQSLEMASLNDTLNEDLRIQYRQQIVTLQNAIDELIKDPNNVVELVNMGLSEEALQNLRESNAMSMAAATLKESDGAESSSSSIGNALPVPISSSSASATAPGSSKAGGGYAVVTTGNGGATGVLNLLQWPKPSADVQQIMQAAAQLQSSEGGSSSSRKTSKTAKRKASELAAEAGGGGTEDMPGMQESGAHAGSGADGSGILDISQLEGGNLRHKKVEIGDTIAECSYVPESQRMVFTGPVHLAALQRKKLRPNITRKVVPLMEPDIGSNFGIEFIPQFILSILHAAIGGSSGGGDDSHGASSGSRSGISNIVLGNVEEHTGQQQQGQGQQPGQQQVQAPVLQAEAESTVHSASVSAHNNNINHNSSGNDNTNTSDTISPSHDAQGSGGHLYGQHVSKDSTTAHQALYNSQLHVATDHSAQQLSSEERTDGSATYNSNGKSGVDGQHYVQHT